MGPTRGMTTLRDAISQHECLKIHTSSTNEIVVFCSTCLKCFKAAKTNHVSDHISSRGHQKAVKLQTPGQSRIVIISEGKRVEDDSLLRLTNAWIGAGLPISALENEDLRKIPEEKFKHPLPCAKTLSTTYADSAASTKMKNLRNLVSEAEAIYLQFDEMELQGQKYYALLVGVLSRDKFNEPYLLQISREQVSPNQTIVQQEIIKALTKLGVVDSFEKFRVFISDAASYNGPAARLLKVTYPKLVHVTCYTHMISRLCVKVAELYSDANFVVKKIKKVFEKCVRRRLEWQQYNGGKDAFPAPVPTRFRTRIKAASFICENWVDLQQFLLQIEKSGCAAAEKARECMVKPGASRSLFTYPSYFFLSPALQRQRRRILPFPKQLSRWKKSAKNW